MLEQLEQLLKECNMAYTKQFYTSQGKNYVNLRSPDGKLVLVFCEGTFQSYYVDVIE